MVEKISRVFARQVLDSRGNPTVECEVHTSSGFSRAMVPSGASTGVHEALELRDNDHCFLGKSVTMAVTNVNTAIAKALVGLDVTDQRVVDNALLALDGTPNKSRLGANAILSASMAACRESARGQGIPLHEFIGFLAANDRFVLPCPASNLINGGAHAGNELDIQEFMVMPLGAKSFAEGIQIVAEIYQTLKKKIVAKYGKQAVNVGDEGGFAPPLKEVREPIELILSAVQELGYSDVVRLALDSAASGFYADEAYTLAGKRLSGPELMEVYFDLKKTYDVYSFEDPFAEDDWLNWSDFTAEVGNVAQVVGDDLLVSNPVRIRKALMEEACNALLLKVNQIGTVSEALEAASLARKNGWKVMVSHRSGETEDSFIADLAVGLGCGQIKSGAPCRSERTAKYNQLLRIEEGLEARGQTNYFK